MIVVRHARPAFVAGVAPQDWELSPEGVVAAAQLGQRLTANQVYASTEVKAIDTATALDLGPVRTSDAFCEVERPFYDDRGELEEAVAAWFEGDVIDGWEPREEAASRFSDEVFRLGPDGLLVVTHGTVLTAHLQSLGLVKDAFAFRTDLRMPDAWEVGPTLKRCP